jgi:hypothetical protein
VVDLKCHAVQAVLILAHFRMQIEVVSISFQSREFVHDMFIIQLQSNQTMHVPLREFYVEYDQFALLSNLNSAKSRAKSRKEIQLTVRTFNCYLAATNSSLLSGD